MKHPNTSSHCVRSLLPNVQQRSSQSWLLPTCILLLILPLLSACQHVARTHYSPQDKGYSCQSNAGTYYLPKKLLKIDVYEKAGFGYGLHIDTAKKMTSDPGAAFCLDFLLSAFADNALGVERSDKLLLQKIYKNTKPKIQPVMGSLIQAAGNLAAANKASAAANKAFLHRQALNRKAAFGGNILGDNPKDKSKAGTRVASYVFDPFNRAEAIAVNQTLRHKYGYCVYFDNSDDPRIPSWSAQSCGKQYTYSQGLSYTDSFFELEKKQGKKAMKHALLYRPELPHKLKVLRKKDPKNPRMRMKLIGTEYINMPNRAPIFALAISHGFFQESSGTVTFNDGMLYDVAIRRKSELNAAIDIPLYALSAVLDIPAAAVNIFNNDLDNRKQLIAVNQQLIHQLEQAEDKALADHAIATAQVGLNQLLVPGDASIVTRQRVPTNIEQCQTDSAFNQTLESTAACQEAVQQGQ